MSSNLEKRLKTVLPKSEVDANRSLGDGRPKTCAAALLKFRAISTGC